jgi:hypothetical protein
VNASTGNTFPAFVDGLSNLPPGNYVVMASGMVSKSDNNSDFAFCDLKSSSGEIQQQGFQTGPPIVYDYSFSGATSLPYGGDIQLTCYDANSPDYGPAAFLGNTITAIQVNALN